MPFLIRELKLSRHSKKRMQQRGIPKEVPFLIKEYGESINTHEDKKYFCNKKTVKKSFVLKMENPFLKDLRNIFSIRQLFVMKEYV